MAASCTVARIRLREVAASPFSALGLTGPVEVASGGAPPSAAAQDWENRTPKALGDLLAGSFFTFFNLAGLGTGRGSMGFLEAVAPS